MKKEGGGCLKTFLIICGIFVLVAAGVGYYVFTHANEWARSGSTFVIESATDAMLKNLTASETEKQAIKRPIKLFTDDIRNGKITMSQGLAVAKELAEGPVISMFLIRQFEHTYLRSSDLTAKQKQEANITIGRFYRGVMTEQISSDSMGEVMSLITEETTDEDGDKTQRLKSSLSDSELLAFITAAKTEADSAGIAAEKFDVDLAAAIKDAIEKGKASSFP